MNAQLNLIAAQQHTAELHRAAARSRAASQVQTTPLRVGKPGPIARFGARLAHSRA
jgi:hypothetical protein